MHAPSQRWYPLAQVHVAPGDAHCSFTPHSPESQHVPAGRQTEPHTCRHGVELEGAAPLVAAAGADVAVTADVAFPEERTENTDDDSSVNADEEAAAALLERAVTLEVDDAAEVPPAAGPADEDPVLAGSPPVTPAGSWQWPSRHARPSTQSSSERQVAAGRSDSHAPHSSSIPRPVAA